MKNNKFNTLTEQSAEKTTKTSTTTGRGGISWNLSDEDIHFENKKAAAENDYLLSSSSPVPPQQPEQPVLSPVLPLSQKSLSPKEEERKSTTSLSVSPVPVVESQQIVVPSEPVPVPQISPPRDTERYQEEQLPPQQQISSQPEKEETTAPKSKPKSSAVEPEPVARKSPESKPKESKFPAASSKAKNETTREESKKTTMSTSTRTTKQTEAQSKKPPLIKSQIVPPPTEAKKTTTTTTTYKPTIVSSSLPAIPPSTSSSVKSSQKGTAASLSRKTLTTSSTTTTTSKTSSSTTTKPTRDVTTKVPNPTERKSFSSVQSSLDAPVVLSPPPLANIPMETKAPQTTFIPTSRSTEFREIPKIEEEEEETELNDSSEEIELHSSHSEESFADQLTSHIMEEINSEVKKEELKSEDRPIPPFTQPSTVPPADNHQFITLYDKYSDNESQSVQSNDYLYQKNTIAATESLSHLSTPQSQRSLNNNKPFASNPYLSEYKKQPLLSSPLSSNYSAPSSADRNAAVDTSSATLDEIQKEILEMRQRLLLAVSYPSTLPVTNNFYATSPPTTTTTTTATFHQQQRQTNIMTGMTLSPSSTPSQEPSSSSSSSLIEFSHSNNVKLPSLSSSSYSSQASSSSSSSGLIGFGGHPRAGTLNPRRGDDEEEEDREDEHSLSTGSLHTNDMVSSDTISLQHPNEMIPEESTSSSRSTNDNNNPLVTSASLLLLGSPKSDSSSSINSEDIDQLIEDVKQKTSFLLSTPESLFRQEKKAQKQAKAEELDDSGLDLFQFSSRNKFLSSTVPASKSHIPSQSLHRTTEYSRKTTKQQTTTTTTLMTSSLASTNISRLLMSSSSSSEVGTEDEDENIENSFHLLQQQTLTSKSGDGKKNRLPTLAEMVANSSQKKTSSSSSPSVDFDEIDDSDSELIFQQKKEIYQKNYQQKYSSLLTSSVELTKSYKSKGKNKNEAVDSSAELFSEDSLSV
jgi:hypothetical protein